MVDNIKVLIISYEMIPFCDSWGSCQRVYYLAEQLIEKGYETWVVSCKDSSKINYHCQKINFKQLFINSYFFKKSENNTTKEINLKKTSSFKGKIWQNIKQFIYKNEKYIFNEPSSQVGILGFLFSLSAIRKIQKKITKGNITTVIISGPPFSTFLISYFIKRRKNKISIFLDYRDPWNLWNGGSFVSNYFEKMILKLVDHVTVTTDSLKTDLSSKFKINSNKISVIYNGYSKKDWQKVIATNNSKEKRIVLSYVGNIGFIKGSYRDMTEFFKAYDLIRKKNKFKIRFIGISYTKEINELTEKYPEIDFIQKVSPTESYAYMLNSDILMNIHSANDNSAYYLIGGKIFDYLKSNKIILSINSKNSFEHTFLKEKTNVICTVNDSNKILKALNLIVENFQNNQDISINKRDVNKLSREHQNLKFIDLIQSKYHTMNT